MLWPLKNSILWSSRISCNPAVVYSNALDGKWWIIILQQGDGQYPRQWIIALFIVLLHLCFGYISVSVWWCFLFPATVQDFFHLSSRGLGARMQQVVAVVPGMICWASYEARRQHVVEDSFRNDSWGELWTNQRVVDSINWWWVW